MQVVAGDPSMVCEVELFLFRTETAVDDEMIDSITGRQDSILVLIDRDSVFSRSHISSAVLHAARSILRGRSRARVEALEVLRWLSGSHQVSRGIEIAGPGKGTTHVIVLKLPESWPGEGDDNELPILVDGKWKGEIPKGLEPLHSPIQLGGDEALIRMGLEFDKDSTFQEKEKMVLEAVCMPALK
jgi:hypothetical protein